MSRGAGGARAGALAGAAAAPYVAAMSSSDPAAACASLVARGDPDRFLAAMAAPLAARGALMTLYAFNLELARAAWVTREPLIARMRLQFWRGVVAGEESAAGGHEVAGPLRRLIAGQALPATLFEAMIAAREAEAEDASPADAGALWRFLEDTSGSLMALSLRALGAEADALARDLGAAQGLANYLLAVPALAAAGRRPLPDPHPEAVAALATAGLERLARARRARAGVPRPARPALLAAWRAGAILRQAAARPGRVAAGGLGQSEFRRRGSLLVRVLAGLGP